MLLSPENWGWGPCAVAVGVAAKSGTISSTNITKRREWVFVIIADLNEFIVDILSLDSFSVAPMLVRNPDPSPAGMNR
jgi:hypothetical protein